MSKEELIAMLQELFRAGKISISLSYHHSRKQCLTVKIDGEVMFEEEIDNGE